MDIFLKAWGEGRPSCASLFSTYQTLSLVDTGEEQTMESGLLFSHLGHASRDGTRVRPDTSTFPGLIHLARRDQFSLFTCFWPSPDSQSLSTHYWPRVVWLETHSYKRDLIPCDQGSCRTF